MNTVLIRVFGGWKSREILGEEAVMILNAEPKKVRTLERRATEWGFAMGRIAGCRVEAELV